MTREEFISRNTIESVLMGRGIELRNGVCRCPLHEDKNPSFSVNREKQVWNCHAGCGGGSVIDLLARLGNVDVITFMKDNGIGSKNGHDPAPQVRPKIVKTYPYHDALGREVFQVVRLEPKSFRQRHAVDGKWVWGMEGVERVLYRLPEVLKSEIVVVCEGEKDADTIASLGLCGTCNVGGAGKWLDGYTDALKGREVWIVGDNDKAGQAHVELVFESIAGKVKLARLIEIPDGHKDVTDFRNSFSSVEEAREAFDALVSKSVPFVGGVKCPVYSMAELEGRYIEHVRSLETDSFALGSWVTKFNRIRPLVPGSMTMIMGDTGVGKTGVLTSLALAAKHIDSLMFEIELPEEDVFERTCAAAMNTSASKVEESYVSGHYAGRKMLDDMFPRLHFCTLPRLDVAEMEKIITRSELKIGRKPKMVLVDYVQLLQGVGRGKTEQMSQIAEDLKRMAKATRTIVVVASQISRPADDDPEIGLHDAKNSGSLENSCGLVIGIWRMPDNPEIMTMKVLKATKGGSGLEFQCRFHGSQTRVVDLDAPEPNLPYPND